MGEAVGRALRGRGEAGDGRGAQMIGTITKDDLTAAIEAIKWAAKRTDHFGCSLTPEEARAIYVYVLELEEKAHEHRSPRDSSSSGDEAAG